MTPGERQAALESIATEIRGCQRCRLATGRTNAVPGEGNPDTEVVFVGEGPGQNEDQQGRPFVGAAGGFLTELLGVIAWRREDVFITNIVKCRPPGNRDPEPDEIGACAPFLRRQLEVLDPALVVTLGRFSMAAFLPGARISQAHGTLRPVDPATGARDATAYAMYHPAAAFRQGGLRETMKLDMLGIPDALQRSRGRRGTTPHLADAGPAAGDPAAGDASVARSARALGHAARGPAQDPAPVTDPAAARDQEGADDRTQDGSPPMTQEELAALLLPGGEDVPDDRGQMGLFQ